MLNAAFNMERYILRRFGMCLFFLSFIPLVKYYRLPRSLVKYSYIIQKLSKAHLPCFGIS